MPRLGPNDIKINDVVIVEAHIKRYHHVPKKDKNSSYNRYNKKKFVSDKNWKYFKVTYELAAISLLLSAPVISDDDSSHEHEGKGNGKGKGKQVSKVFTY